MSLRMVMLGLLVGVSLAPTAVRAQQRPDSLGEKAEQIRTGTAITGVRKINRANLNTYYNSRVSTTGYRLTRLRQMLPMGREGLSLLSDPSAPQTRIQRILEDRNLLRVRSPLAKSGTALLGRVTPGLGTEGRMGAPWGSSAVLGTTTEPTTQSTTQPADDGQGPVRFEVALADRLNATAARNFELGAACFRAGDLLRARYHFDLTKDLWLDQARPYVASMIVSFEVGDYNRSALELLRAFQLAKTLDDLRIDGFADKFLAGDDEEQRQRMLTRMVDTVNRFALTDREDPMPKVLLAYYSWLNGDVSVAVATAEEAARGASEPKAGNIRKFHDMLAEEQRAATTRPNPG
jgi:hypothetical protein